jgi:hypothetical protein
MTISHLRQLNKKNGGCFFDKATMKFYGETLRDFFQEPHCDGVVKVSRRNGKGTWYFSTVTGRVVNGFANSQR